MLFPLKTRVTIVFAIAAINVFSFTGDHKISPNQNSLIISFENFVADKPLQLDSVSYKNEMGQEYVVTKFKYYIGNIHLKESNGNEYSSDEYFLINEQTPESKKIILNNIPSGEYTSISFMLGVDSLRNCSGIQSGALDPIHGMFWAWNTGYIFLKLDGRSPKSTSNGNILEYHIGGFQNPSNSIRYISLKFENDNLSMEGNEIPSLVIKADISQILKSPSTIDFSKLPTVTDNHNAAIIADNYRDMFSIIKIKK